MKKVMGYALTKIERIVENALKKVEDGRMKNDKRIFSNNIDGDKSNKPERKRDMTR